MVDANKTVLGVVNFITVMQNKIEGFHQVYSNVVSYIFTLILFYYRPRWSTDIVASRSKKFTYYNL